MDNSPADMTILILLTNYNGEFPGGLQADIAAENTVILDIEQIAMSIQIVVHPLQSVQIVNSVSIIHLFAENGVLIPWQGSGVVVIVGDEGDVRGDGNSRAGHANASIRQRMLLLYNTEKRNARFTNWKQRFLARAFFLWYNETRKTYAVTACKEVPRWQRRVFLQM